MLNCDHNGTEYSIYCMLLVTDVNHNNDIYLPGMKETNAQYCSALLMAVLKHP